MSSYKDPHSQTYTQTSINALTSVRTFSVFSTSVSVSSRTRSLRQFFLEMSVYHVNRSLGNNHNLHSLPVCPVDHTTDSVSICNTQVLDLFDYDCVVTTKFL